MIVPLTAADSPPHPTPQALRRARAICPQLQASITGLARVGFGKATDDFQTASSGSDTALRNLCDQALLCVSAELTPSQATHALELGAHLDVLFQSSKPESLPLSDAALDELTKDPSLHARRFVGWALRRTLLTELGTHPEHLDTALGRDHALIHLVKEAPQTAQNWVALCTRAFPSHAMSGKEPTPLATAVMLCRGAIFTAGIPERIGGSLAAFPKAMQAWRDTADAGQALVEALTAPHAPNYAQELEGLAHALGDVAAVFFKRDLARPSDAAPFAPFLVEWHAAALDWLSS